MQAATKITQRSASAASGKAVTIFAFSRDLASTSKEAILSAYQALPASAAILLLDFKGVDYINSSGIAIIIQLLLEAHKSGARKVAIFGLSAHFVKVFTMVGVAKYAGIFADEAAALGTL